MAEQYLGVAAVAELLDRDVSRIYQLRRDDRRFPSHAVEIIEPSGVRKGWRRADIIAYQLGKTAPKRPVPQYLGVAAFAAALNRTPARLWQYERTDPAFPAHAVEVVERKGVRKGWREADVAAFRDHRRQKAAAN